MDLKGLLAGIATIMGILCTFAALILFAMNKIGGDSAGGGMGEKALIGCVIAAVACYAAAAWIATQSLDIVTS